MSDRLNVSEESGLLPFLISGLDGWSRKKIKQRLQGGCVVVNGDKVTKHDHALKPGDKVEIRAVAKGVRHHDGELEILYSDGSLVAINKPAGLLSGSYGPPRISRWTLTHGRSSATKCVSGPRGHRSPSRR